MNATIVATYVYTIYYFTILGLRSVRVHEVTVEGKRKGGSFQAHSGASSSTPTPRSGPSPSTVTPPSHLLRRVWLSPDWVHVGWTGGAVWWCGRWLSSSFLLFSFLIRAILNKKGTNFYGTFKGTRSLRSLS